MKLKNDKKYKKNNLSKFASNKETLKKAGLLLGVLLFVVIGVVFSFSQAYFIKRIEGSNITVKVGELEYTLECDQLNNKQITLSPNSSKNLDLKLTSLNPIDSKYELYYKIISPQNPANKVEAGYVKDSEKLPLDIVSQNSNNNIKIMINNTGNEEVTIEIGIAAGLVHNETELKEEEISLNKEIIQKNYIYDFTGNYQTFIAPVTGYYKIELWGASGGGTSAGKGAYTKGEITLNQGTPLYLYVGENGETDQHVVFNNGNQSRLRSYNDKAGYMYAGGGATDVRITSGEWDDFNSLKTRIMVAAGGGGMQTYYATLNGGAAGGLTGYNGAVSGSDGRITTGGTQISGGQNGLGTHSVQINNAGFGIMTNFSHIVAGAGGGSGYYSGGTGAHGSSTVGSGAGGSSFISGHSGCDAIAESSTKSNIVHTNQSIHYSNLSFSNTTMIDGLGYSWTTTKGSQTNMPTHDLTSTMVGNTGNGYIRITLLGYDVYNVKYESNGGTGTMADSEFGVGLEGTLSTNTFQKRGHSFQGWATSPEGAVVYTNNQKIKDLASKDETVTLYAIWKANTYKITYNGNGGLYNGSTTWSENVTYGQNYKTWSNNNFFTRTGYTFVGWNEKADGTGVDWTNYINKDWVWTYIRDATLYAIWKPNTYTITYNGNGGLYNGNPTWSETVTYGQNYKTWSNFFTRSGYTFTGWNEKADGTGVSWTSYINKNWVWTYTRNATLYATWKASTSTVSAPTLSYINHEVTGVHGSMSQTEKLDSYSVSGNKVYWSWKYASSGSAYIYTKVAQTYNVTDYKYLKVTINQEEKVESSSRSKIRVGSASATFGANAGTSSVVLDLSSVTGNQTIYFDAYMAFNRSTTYENFTGYIYLTELYFYN